MTHAPLTAMPTTTHDRQAVTALPETPADPAAAPAGTGTPLRPQAGASGRRGPSSPLSRPPVRRDPRRPGERSARGVRAAAGPPRQGRSPQAQSLQVRAPHHWFAQQLLLVLSGDRPVHRLFGYAHFSVLDQLIRLAPRTPLRPHGARRAAPAVADIGVQQPSTGVLEVFARIATGDRQRAMAFRLEAKTDGPRWRCTALELDGQT